MSYLSIQTGVINLVICNSTWQNHSDHVLCWNSFFSQPTLLKLLVWHGPAYELLQNLALERSLHGTLYK